MGRYTRNIHFFFTQNLSDSTACSLLYTRQMCNLMHMYLARRWTSTNLAFTCTSSPTSPSMRLPLPLHQHETLQPSPSPAAPSVGGAPQEMLIRGCSLGDAPHQPRSHPRGANSTQTHVLFAPVPACKDSHPNLLASKLSAKPGLPSRAAAGKSPSLSPSLHVPAGTYRAWMRKLSC